MAKLSDKKIQKQDINDYLNNYSDFTFEISVLNKLTNLGFRCEHSGTYEDPITKKTREFDIRAQKIEKLNENIQFRFCMAVECKNLRENFPLVVHCLPRSKNESYQNLIWSHYSHNDILPTYKYGRRIRLDKDSVYKEGEFVGKSCDQVGRKFSNTGEIVGSDSDVFDKISQSINSTFDIVDGCHYAGVDTMVISVVIPVLVVPNDRIWQVCYDYSGNIIDGPNLTPKISYYIDKNWRFGGGMEESVTYYLSHMEIVQLDSIETLINAHNQENRYTYENIFEYMTKILHGK